MLEASRSLWSVRRIASGCGRDRYQIEAAIERLAIRPAFDIDGVKYFDKSQILGIVEEAERVDADGEINAPRKA